MNIERIKSVILTILVIMSLGLTAALWTYQPSNQELKSIKDETKEVLIGEEEEYKSLLIPSKLFVHKEDKSFINKSVEQKEELFNVFKNIKIHDFEEYATELKPKKLFNFIHQNNHVVLQYDTEMPISLYKNIFKISDKYINSLYFNTIVIPYKTKGKERTIYFINTKELSIYRATMEEILQYKLNNVVEMMSVNENRVERIDITKEKALFIPMNATDISTRQYLIKETSQEDFVDIFFNEPSYINKIDEGNITAYTDGIRLLQVDNNKNELIYRKPANIENQALQGGNLVTQSTDFINSHGGFTDQFLFYEWKEKRGEVQYRLFLNNIPVYSNQYKTTIDIKMGQEEVLYYSRPTYMLEIEIKEGEIITPLSSGKETWDILSRLKDFTPDLIQDMFIGYELETIHSQQGVKTALFTPTWCIRYNNQVYSLDDFITKSEGVYMNGLE